jgi:hypothetical protein
MSRGVGDSVDFPKYTRQQHLALQAAKCGRLDIVRRLVESAPDAVRWNSVLKEAANFGHVALAQYLCELPPGYGVFPNTTMVNAAYDGHLAAVKCLCELPPECGVNPAWNNNSALRNAARHGRVVVVEYLCGLPAVDPRVLVRPKGQFSHAAQDIARAEMERRRRWSDLRAAWTGAVAQAGGVTCSGE